MMAVAPIQLSVEVPLAPAEAFDLFCLQLQRWWPPEYTWSQDALVAIGIEPTLGGLCYERGPHNFRCDWGRVVQWDPPARVALTWQIDPHRVPVPDPARASVVDVRFAGRDASTLVTLEHRDFARHGDDAQGYRDAMASPQGWPFILERYRQAAG